MSSIFDFEVKNCEVGKYQSRDCIGYGSYSVVYKDINKDNHLEVAIKNYMEEDNFIAEMECFKLLETNGDTSHIVKRYEICYVPGKRICLCAFELLPSNLKTIIKNLNVDTSICENAFRNYVFQLLSAVAYCHQRNLVHRDIKPENILIDPSKQLLKLCDFGCAVETTHIRNPDCFGSMSYLPPEVHLRIDTDYAYIPSLDLWSIGCVIAEMYFQKSQPIFMGQNYVDILWKIFDTFGSPLKSQYGGIYDKCEPNIIGQYPGVGLVTYMTRYCEDKNRYNNEKCIDLMNKLLHLDPAARISAAEALKHPFFDTNTTN
jgi:serine/threonine protein kinase